MNKRKPEPSMNVIPRFVYNPDKAERGLKAIADILAGALRRAEKESSAPPTGPDVGT
jgi:hypothetical protein